MEIKKEIEVSIIERMNGSNEDGAIDDKQRATRENKERVRNNAAKQYGMVLGVVFDMENQKKLFTSGEKWWNQ